MGDPQVASEHLDRLSRLATALAGRGLAIYEHHYYMLVMGSFRLEVGTRHERWVVSWDGKEGFIDISEPYAAEPGSLMKPVAGQTMFLGFGPDIPYAFLETFEFRRPPAP